MKFKNKDELVLHALYTYIHEDYATDEEEARLRKWFPELDKMLEEAYKPKACPKCRGENWIYCECLG